MPEFIRCNDGEAFVNANGNRIICTINDGAEILTESQIIEIYEVSDGPVEMSTDFYSVIAYACFFFALVHGFQSGKTR